MATKKQQSSQRSSQKSSQKPSQQTPRVDDVDDRKAREYRDAQGRIHHHTRKYMEAHRSEMQPQRNGGGRAKK
ncbi:MAG: hypothetical protein KF773_21535 [Deltaproteobacteria bacterium]|nr:hypothetical protein [Deltaproteobacteria bacterium]MCW5806110.1 hypothetical protein [Deltaproteobacteria bacterium]